MTILPLTVLARQAFIQDELNASAAVKKAILDQCTDKIIMGVDVLINALNKGGKILLCGNGGSAADAQHLATELIIRMDPKIKRPAIPAIALSTDSSMLSAGANDIGYDNVFARAVEGLGRAGDVLIGISTSGQSASINNALETARARGLATIALLGKDGGKTKNLADVAIIVPSHDTQRIQEGHITIGHIMCALVEREMYA
jgi:D-sedoheptulose 7-phosphate isomerase